jgi:RHS repeat-associated protein
LIEETNSSGTAVARYSQGLNIDEPLAMLRSSTTSYYQADGLGSITSLSSGAGSLTQTYTFDSFGKQTASSGSLTNPFQYTARESDPETGLYYYRARYYDPSVGRFLNEDPRGFVEGMDFYIYVDDDPLRFIDPFGMAPGDKYKTRRQAGVQAIVDILDKSICTHTEYAGALYQNPDGTYSYTKPRSETKADSSVHWEDMPKGTRVAGDYHTHGGYDPGYDNENFSPDDMDSNDDEGPTGKPGYLGTPKGAIKIYLGDKAHKRQGKIIIVDPGIKEGNQKPCPCN